MLVSDTLMFQRAAPQPSDENLGRFYGLALPLLMRGMPVEPVQIESASPNPPPDFLSGNRVYDLAQRAARSAHLALKETNALVLRRGPYVVIAGLDKDPADRGQPSAHAVSVTGDLINLFDADLSETSEVAVRPGTRAGCCLT